METNYPFTSTVFSLPAPMTTTHRDVTLPVERPIDAREV